MQTWTTKQNKNWTEQNRYCRLSEKQKPVRWFCGKGHNEPGIEMHWFLFHSLLPPTSITTNSHSLSISFKAQQNWQDAPNDLLQSRTHRTLTAPNKTQITNEAVEIELSMNTIKKIINTANTIVPQMGEICITVNNEWWIDFSSLSLMFCLCSWPAGKRPNHISSKQAQRKAFFSWF